MGYLLLVRHGESRWNITNRFTGWIDVPLSEKGLKEAIIIAKRIKHLRLDAAFTSNLERARETLLAILAGQHCTGIFQHVNEPQRKRYHIQLVNLEIPIYSNWLLNERHYGILQGMKKNRAQRIYGIDQVLKWRRSFEARPPKGESLSDVYKRAVSYFKSKIMPEIKKNKNVLIVAHGNTLRALIKYIDMIPDEKIANLELTPNRPFIYKYHSGKLIKVFKSYTFNRPISWK